MSRVTWTCRYFSCGGQSESCQVQATGGADALPAGWQVSGGARGRDKFWRGAACPECVAWGRQLVARARASADVLSALLRRLDGGD